MTTTPPPGDDHEFVPVVSVDTSNLRALAHPLRLRALGLLRRNGPATATQLAAQLGESSGALSYHLRQLEAYGFITDDDRPGAGRERWWRAVHRTSRYDNTDATPEERLAGAEYLRAVGHVYGDRLHRFADRWDTLDDEVGREYSDAATMSDWNLRLTPARVNELRAAVEQLLEGYRDAPDTGDEIVPVAAMFMVLPGRTA